MDNLMTDTTNQPDQPAQDRSQNVPEPETSAAGDTPVSNTPAVDIPMDDVQNPAHPQSDIAAAPSDEQPDEPETDDAPGDDTLDHVEVKINFRIGEISMPVNELAALTPGFTLTDLPGLIFPRAVALASGRAFAEGELVEIDGKIGFRITRLLS